MATKQKPATCAFCREVLLRGRATKCDACELRVCDGCRGETRGCLNEECSLAVAAPLDYDAWLGQIVQDPFRCGWHGQVVVGASVLACLVALVAVGPIMAQNLPAGRYPAVVL